MLSKPLSFILVFILTTANFVFLILPLSILIFPLFLLFQSLFIKIGPDIFFFMVSRVSLIIIGYIFVDTVFGFTERRLRKGCVRFDKVATVYAHKEIMDAFDLLKQKFGMKNVKLYLDPNLREENAYAIGSFSGSSITITQGLLNQIQLKAKSHAEYLDAVCGILGHEMSHLANMDFLPGMLTSASETANRHLSNIIRLLFVIIAKIIGIIPAIGQPVARLLVMFYNLLNFMIMAFFNYVFSPLYKFMQRFFSRAIEYRCDRESAYAFGGKKMATALSFLGAGGYFTIFSTHPNTKTRIRKVEDILPREGRIRPNIISTLSSFAAMVLVAFVCIYSTSLTNIPGMYEHYINDVYIPLQQKYYMYHGKAMQWYYMYKPQFKNF